MPFANFFKIKIVSGILFRFLAKSANCETLQFFLRVTVVWLLEILFRPGESKIFFDFVSKCFVLKFVVLWIENCLNLKMDFEDLSVKLTF